MASALHHPFRSRLLTKESGAVFLLLIFAYELTLGRTLEADNTKPARIPLAFAILSAIALTYFIVRWIVLHSPIGRPATIISFASSILTMPIVVLRYLRMLVAPYDMSAFFPGDSFPPSASRTSCSHSPR